MKAVITVTGKDTVGIIADVATVCAKHHANILDITQSVLSEYFAMIMLADIDKLNVGFSEFVDVLENKGGFISAHWDGTVETEVAIKEATKATIRCIPLDVKEEEGTCIYSGKPSKCRVLFARSY